MYKRKSISAMKARVKRARAITRATTVTVVPPFRARRPRYQNQRTSGFLGIERKFYDTNLIATAIPASTDFTATEFDPSATAMMTTPPVGNGEQTRDGKQISALYLEFNCVVQNNASEAQTGPTQGCKVFIAIVLDTQSNAAQCQGEDIFKNTNAVAETAMLPMRNLLNAKRFRVLKQAILNLDRTSLSSAALNDFSSTGVSRAFKWFIPLKGMRINFNAGTTASIANVVDNSIHVIANCNLTTSQLAYNARLRFVG